MCSRGDVPTLFVKSDFTCRGLCTSSDDENRVLTLRRARRTKERVLNEKSAYATQGF